MISISQPKMLPFPHKCLLCGSDRRACFNFPVTQQWNGALLICMACAKAFVNQFAEELSVVPGDRYDKLHGMFAVEKAKAEKADRAVEIVREAIDGIRSDIARLFSGNSASSDRSDFLLDYEISAAKSSSS